MIADLDSDLCIGCGACVSVCPANVFDAGPDQPGVARPDACQTCFLCELYCPADALFVDPDCETQRSIDRSWLGESNLRGKFRRDAGWGDSDAPNLHWMMDGIFSRAFALVQARSKK
jgi:NAD-dependent dihydropyrimidine dehydrogenase PreA subunit